MNSGLTVALDVTTIMAAVMVVVTPLKGLLEAFVPPANRLHDALVQLLALLVGVLFGLIAVWAEGPLTRSAEVAFIIALLLGIGGGSAAVGTYHIARTMTRDNVSPETPPVPEPAPPVSADDPLVAPIQPQDP